MAAPHWGTPFSSKLRNAEGVTSIPAFLTYSRIGETLSPPRSPIMVSPKRPLRRSSVTIPETIWLIMSVIVVVLVILRVMPSAPSIVPLSIETTAGRTPEMSSLTLASSSSSSASVTPTLSSSMTISLSFSRSLRSNLESAYVMSYHERSSITSFSMPSGCVKI